MAKSRHSGQLGMIRLVLGAVGCSAPADDGGPAAPAPPDGATATASGSDGSAVGSDASTSGSSSAGSTGPVQTSDGISDGVSGSTTSGTLAGTSTAAGSASSVTGDQGAGGSSGGSDGDAASSASGGTGSGAGGDSGSSASGGAGGTDGVVVDNPLTDPEQGPPAGSPDGACAVPAAAGLEDSSQPDTVVGTGSQASCTADAFIDAVAQGGVITFDCGSEPTTIVLDRPAKVFNDQNPDIVIDGGGLVTLSGGGTSRILYMNTCDEDQVWTTSECQNQDHPRLTVQNLTFVDGNSKNETEYDGGGAIWVRGGRFKVVNSRFFNNVCADEGPDVGGAGIRVFSQYEGLPVYVVNTTFGGQEGFGNVCSNGGGISSIGVSWTIINSLFSHNQAVGEGGNPAEEGTPGGGSGGAIYNDGNTMTLSLCGTLIEDNQVNAYGSAIFFVSNDRSGDMVITDSTIRNNTGGGWNVLPGISMHEETETNISGSTIE